MSFALLPALSPFTIAFFVAVPSAVVTTMTITRNTDKARKLIKLTCVHHTWVPWLRRLPTGWFIVFCPCPFSVLGTVADSSCRPTADMMMQQIKAYQVGMPAQCPILPFWT
ncbi:hypothetical protein X797_003326 [Metarhizium robertsii]|uniref:Uncharacterized protein n=1 Tax=Metarhizium robertsii TaxID=568076 RepID=A0A0A1V1N7_9HYPO|nr:hypothetical protein X797_003326 [Metarhizium robertsii]